MTPAACTTTTTTTSSAALAEATVCRVVVVDDNDDVRRLLRIQVSRVDGCEVVGDAADGTEAIDVVARTSPDLVLLDMSLPDMDGVDAIAPMRRACPDVRIVVLSAHEAAFAERRCLDAGAIRYVEKALRIDFRAVVDDALRIRPLRSR